MIHFFMHLSVLGKALIGFCLFVVYAVIASAIHAIRVTRIANKKDGETAERVAKIKSDPPIYDFNHLPLFDQTTPKGTVASNKHVTVPLKRSTQFDFGTPRQKTD
jgi:hypothetical protein